MATPYLLGFEPNVRFSVIATVGDTVDTKSDGTPYRMVGIPDGLGAWDNGDGTISVTMNHELGSSSGIVRDHGAAGAFVSKWTLNKSDLSIVGVEDAIKKVYLWNDSLAAANTDTNGDGVIDAFVETTYAIGRLCSADLAAPTAYQWTDPNSGIVYGTADLIHTTGEEIGSEGKGFAVVLTGAEAGNAYEMAYTGLFSWENAVSSPLAQKKTIMIGLDDSNGGQLYVYVGEKKTVGNTIDKAGLNDGNVFAIKVLNLVDALNPAASNETNAVAASGRFELFNHGDVSAVTGAALEASSEANGVTSFMRPEDGQFDPTNPNVFWFVTTAGTTSQSRLYKLTFDDITNPESGGTIEAVLQTSDLPTNDGVGPRMMDNMTVNADGKVIIQEDIGNNDHVGRIFEYDPVTDTVVVIAEHNRDLFSGNAATNPTFITRDEESSGVIEVTDLLNYTNGKAYLVDVQSHLNLPDPELVQDGQFLAMFVDDVKPNGSNNSDAINGSAAKEYFFGNGGDDIIRTGSGSDLARGGTGNDMIYGGKDGDKLAGGDDNDMIDGGAGNDSIRGEDGDDVLIGGLGGDNLYGGAGADMFAYFSVEESMVGNRDRIRDFNAAEGDKIDLSAIDAIAGGTDDAFTRVSAFTGTAGELKVTFNASAQFATVEADVNGDGMADMQFVMFGVTSLAADAFVL